MVAVAAAVQATSTQIIRHKAVLGHTVQMVVVTVMPQQVTTLAVTAVTAVTVQSLSSIS
jgi:hypothetical protein